MRFSRVLSGESERSCLFGSYIFASFNEGASGASACKRPLPLPVETRHPQEKRHARFASRATQYTTILPVAQPHDRASANPFA